MNLDHLNDTTLWVAVHDHKYGVDTYPFTTSTKAVMPTIEQIVTACGIDFEPNRNEYITIAILELSKNPIPHIGD